MIAWWIAPTIYTVLLIATVVFVLRSKSVDFKELIACAIVMMGGIVALVFWAIFLIIKALTQ